MSALDKLAGIDVRLLLPAATELVWAVRLRVPVDIDEAIEQASSRADLRALLVLLAAMVPDDASPSRLLGWLDNPEGYLRLREQGVSQQDATKLLWLNRGM